MVSHDRFFINKIADSLLIFKSSGVSYFDGKYEDYERELEEAENEEKITKPEESVKQEKPANNLYLKQKEMNKISNRIKKLERDIDALENNAKEINEQLSNECNYSDYEKLSELQAQIERINSEIEEKMSEWEELQEKLNGEE